MSALFVSCLFRQLTDGFISSHYHSNYDSFWWMDNFGDPGFEYHATIARILALLAAKLVEEPVISFNATDYAVGLERYLQSVKDIVSSSQLDEAAIKDSFKPLDQAISAFQRASMAFDHEAAVLNLALSATDIPRPELYQSVHATNTKYKLLERQFTYAPGLDSRSWFKHVVFAPGLWTGYAGATYPGLVEAIDANNKTAVEKWVDIIEKTVLRATDLLMPQ